MRSGDMYAAIVLLAAAGYALNRVILAVERRHPAGTTGPTEPGAGTSRRRARHRARGRLHGHAHRGAARPATGSRAGALLRRRASTRRCSNATRLARAEPLPARHRAARQRACTPGSSGTPHHAGAAWTPARATTRNAPGGRASARTSDTPFLERLRRRRRAAGRASTSSCAPPAGAPTIGWNTRFVAANGCRPSRTRATCSRAPRSTCAGTLLRLAAGAATTPRGASPSSTACCRAGGGLRRRRARDRRAAAHRPAGHTPGPHGAAPRGRRGGVFCGDAIHHPLPICAPHEQCFCEDPARSARHAPLAAAERCAEHGTGSFPRASAR
jgi:hypothetical protein